MSDTLPSSAYGSHGLNLSNMQIPSSTRGALRNGNLPLAIDLFKRVVELDPKHTSGWNALGLVYLQSMQLSESEAAFRKQIELNSYDENAYNNLGRVLQLRQRGLPWRLRQQAFRCRLVDWRNALRYERQDACAARAEAAPALSRGAEAADQDCRRGACGAR